MKRVFFLVLCMGVLKVYADDDCPKTVRQVRCDLTTDDLSRTYVAELKRKKRGFFYELRFKLPDKVRAYAGEFNHSLGDQVRNLTVKVKDNGRFEFKGRLLRRPTINTFTLTIENLYVDNSVNLASSNNLERLEYCSSEVTDEDVQYLNDLISSGSCSDDDDDYDDYCTLSGDINQDGVVNEQDITALQAILGQSRCNAVESCNHTLNFRIRARK